MVNNKNNTTKYISHSLEDTAFLAGKLAKKLEGGEVILLNGELGAGKTAFTKCLAKCLEIDDIVTSPTFTFMKEYKGRLALYHFDMYRVTDADELYELGLNDYLYMDGVCVIEWNKFDDLPNHIDIDISTLSNGKDREFVINGLDLEI
ncbi:MAG: tRNA (adenosine(37)-N6)-threonylcarbamoyltransferase complex ATPase subunit type 1 TsaE [Clostridia bacterium]|nr:tRNA (adenosine(37)-N6)-threonylcarbamoyltransferase complex ATPase subunit type 1 TsaE [Clostridia bacterium]